MDLSHQNRDCRKIALIYFDYFPIRIPIDRGVSIVIFEYHRRWSYCIDWVLKAHVLVRLCICSCMRFQFF